MLKHVSLAAFLLCAAACATAPQPVVPAAPAPAPVQVPTQGPVISSPQPVLGFDVLPGWSTSPIAPGVLAFSRSCGKIAARPDNAPLADAALWAGTVQEWREACEAITVIQDEASARTVMEALFVPVEIVDPEDQPRFTGYFEPSIEARFRPEGAFTAPVPGPPSDLVQGANGPLQRLSNGRTRPYPPRAEIVPEPSKIIGYAHPADVFFLQIQGSGRLNFPDGSAVRAAYHAHNGQPFQSTANWLIRNGKISRGEASMQGIRAWMDRVSAAEAQRAMNANPRYVFFDAKPIGDPSLGPVGAQNIPLTAFGSMAVDTGLHALGVPFFVQTTAPGLGGEWSGLLVAQDTGGAIKGPVRGDIFFGTGFEAGQRAGTMNAPGRKWALLPRAVAERLKATEPEV